MRKAYPARWRAWIGLVAAPFVWALHHQLISNLDYADCRRGITPLGLAVGVGGLALIALAAWITGPAARPANVDHPGRFIAWLSLMACLLFGLTVLAQTVAVLILPPCYR